jgi:hypothetical protein
MSELIQAAMEVMKKENSEQKCRIRLLVPASRQEVNSIELCGRHWVVAEFADISDTPSYTCISYSWGTGRIIQDYLRDDW